MAINTIKATMQMRRGEENHFDPDQMTAGEWAVSVDTKKVWMCFKPGLVLRMATYEAFEEDMKIIQQILATCRDIQEAVEAFERLAEQHKNQAESYSKTSKSWAVGGTGTRAGEDADNSKYYSQQSANSATSASNSATAATNKATEASTSASNAANSATSASNSATTATQKATDSGNSASAASQSAHDAAGSAVAAKKSEDNAKASEEKADDYSLVSKSYAVGTDGAVRPNDATDNSKFYSELAKKLTDEAQKLLDQAQKIISAASTGALVPAGTVAFEDLPDEPKVGYMYNISNDFVTDSRFVEGTGVFYRAGANIYWTKDGQWDVMVGTQVTGIKGSAETEYRIGNVNITKANVGLGNVPDVTTNDQTPTFTQAATRENIASGNKMSVILGKIMKWYSDLKAVAFSGSYNDLSNKPTIPSVGNGTLTIQKNGANVQTFTANQGTNATANITVPTKASDIGAVATTKVLTTKEQIDANTDTGNVAGATAVKAMVNEINSNLSWKHFGLFTTATGQLPDDFEEILVWVSCGVAYNFAFYFKNFMLFESANYFRTGHYNTPTDCSGCTISITKKQFSTIVYIDQNVEQNIRINVYYR